ncbi:MAG: ORF6N domain-containing protein [Rikenellaceae bacterium]
MEQIAHIQSKIFEIRGQKVMLDRDLAQMYGVETSQLKRAVKRNIKRFEGEDFMFELTKEEVSRCQFGTLNVNGRGSNMKYLPFVFTELGVAMLSSVLRSELAIEVNRSIMRVFVAIRHSLPVTTPINQVEELKAEINELKEYIEDVFTDYNDINDDTRMQLELINETLAKLQTGKNALGKPRTPIGYKVPQK